MFSLIFTGVDQLLDCRWYFYSRLIDVGRRLDKADRAALTKCAQYLAHLEQYPHAAEMYTKMNDIKSLVHLFVHAKLWEDVSISDVGVIGGMLSHVG